MHGNTSNIEDIRLLGRPFPILSLILLLIYMIIVAEQVRLRQWAAQIQECQSRPSDMKGEIWCNEHGITKANLNILVR